MWPASRTCCSSAGGGNAGLLGLFQELVHGIDELGLATRSGPQPPGG
ncbi:hypothetical protein [Streptomyces sp. NPDC001435]